MGAMGWIAGHWVDILQTVGIVSGLFATAYNIRADRLERKVETEMALVAGHRDIWSRLYDDPALARVLDPAADIEAVPISVQEERLVLFVILHARAAFKARKHGMTFGDDDVVGDAESFFSLPIPANVWKGYRRFLGEELISFVENAKGARYSESMKHPK